MKRDVKHAGKLEGKIALITGGNSGIGLATAKQFVNEGAYVFVTGRREAELAAAKKQIGKNVTAIQGDVSNLDDLDRLFAQIKKEKGRIDIVFANAGVARYAPIGTITEDFFDSIFDINVKGVLFTVQKALPLLRDGGSIILNASIVGSKGLSSNSVYSATKAAVRTMTEGLRMELHSENIRCTIISPGAVESELKNKTSDPSSAAFLKDLYKKIAIPADSVARAVLYAMEQPADVEIDEVVLRPTAQDF